jgi:uncharacterized protein
MENIKDKLEKLDVETRYLELELRAAEREKKPVIEGTAAVYDQEAVIGDWFREKIQRGAFDRVLSEKPDVIGAPNHDWSVVLGRTSSGTLRLDATQRGLNYSIDVNPDDQEAMNLYQRIKRGDVFQSSFAFTVREEEWIYPEKGSKDLPMRVVKEVEKLFDVSPVTFPAYPQTSAGVRSRFGNSSGTGDESDSSNQAESGGSEGEAEKMKSQARAKARGRSLELDTIKLTPGK